MWTALIGPIAGLAKTWINNRHEQSQAKHVAKMEVIKNTATWEQEMAAASATSWKDEWFTVVLSLPMVAVTASFGIRGADKLMQMKGK